MTAICLVTKGESNADVEGAFIVVKTYATDSRKGPMVP